MYPSFQKDSNANSWNLRLVGSALGMTCESRVDILAKQYDIPLDIEQLQIYY